MSSKKLWVYKNQNVEGMENFETCCIERSRGVFSNSSIVTDKIILSPTKRMIFWSSSRKKLVGPIGMLASDPYPAGDEPTKYMWGTLDWKNKLSSTFVFFCTPPFFYAQSQPRRYIIPYRQKIYQKKLSKRLTSHLSALPFAPYIIYVILRTKSKGIHLRI
jgi:hypothetical protein